MKKGKRKGKPKDKYITVAEYARNNKLSRPGVYYRLDHDLIKYEIIAGHKCILRDQR